MFRNLVKRYETLLMILMGILCIVFQSHIYREFPILFGLFMLERGVHGCYTGWKNGDFYTRDQSGLEHSALIVVLAVGIMIRQHEALIVAAIFWGVAGIFKSAKYLNELFYQIAQKERISFMTVFAFLLELVLSLILIFEPLNNVEHHILILGIQLVAEGILGTFVKTREHIRSKTQSADS